jgi:flagellar hook-basal body complex protein FliE
VTAPTVDPAQVAVDEVFAAINAARGGRDGLNGSDAHDLESLAANVRSAHQDSDFEAAREATDKLRERADKLTENMDEGRRERLRDAIAALEDAIPED